MPFGVEETLRVSFKLQSRYFLPQNVQDVCFSGKCNASGNIRFSQAEQALRLRCQSPYINTFGQLWLMGQQTVEFVAQGMGKRIAQGREQNPRVWIGAGQMYCPVQGDNSFSRSCGATYLDRSVEAALHQGALIGMKEDQPLVPWVVQGTLQLFRAAHEAETTLGVRVLKSDREILSGC